MKITWSKKISQDCALFEDPAISLNPNRPKKKKSYDEVQPLGHVC